MGKFENKFLYVLQEDDLPPGDGIDEVTARMALYKASTKLPIKTKFIKRF